MSAAAAKFAANRHQGQTRKDGKTPYINHPVQVRNILLREAGITEPDELEAALLHDTIEDTGLTRDELAAVFGDDVAGLVAELTNDENPESKHQAQLARSRMLSRKAARVRLADKIANQRDVISRPPTRWKVSRRVRFLREAREVVDVIAWASPDLASIFYRENDAGMAQMGQL